jgi:glycosyltransferase involved in cell wall biosynthesis
MSAAHQAGIENDIQYLGYVPNHDISAIYAEATGLVMPTFFGPTNIPVLEAWSLGCPVLSSDIRGIREQIQSAGILVDPRSVESIADGIQKLWTENKLREELIRQGRSRLATYTPASYRKRLIDILEESKLRVRHMCGLKYAALAALLF